MRPYPSGGWGREMSRDGVGAGYEHVVCVRIFLTDFERDYAALNRIYTEYFEPGRLPARRLIPLSQVGQYVV